MSVSSISSAVASYRSKVSDYEARQDTIAQSNRDVVEARKAEQQQAETQTAAAEQSKPPVREGVGRVIDITV